MSLDEDLAGVLFAGFLVGVPFVFLLEAEEHLEHIHI